jgi:hypothetical protein
MLILISMIIIALCTVSFSSNHPLYERRADRIFRLFPLILACFRILILR